MQQPEDLDRDRPYTRPDAPEAPEAQASTPPCASGDTEEKPGDGDDADAEVTREPQPAHAL